MNWPEAVLAIFQEIASTALIIVVLMIIFGCINININIGKKK